MKTKHQIMICVILTVIIICLLPILFSLKDEVDQSKQNINTNVNQDTNSTIEKDEILLTFKENQTIEYGSDYTSKDLIQTTNGELVNEPILDTMKLGKQELVYLVKNNEEEREFKYTIEIVDTQKPIIETAYDHIIFDYAENIDFSLLAINVYDLVDETIELSNELIPHSYILEHQIDTKVAGEYTLTIKAMDKNQLTSEKEIRVTVKEEEKVDSSEKNNDTNANNQQTTFEPTYINGILIVNKQYGVPRDFGGHDDTAYNALLALQNGAALAGYDMPLLSGYRSYDYQKSLYESYVARDGVEAANRYSAKPGTSEHQTGLAFDVGEMSWTYGETAAGQWLVNHCAEYGFILRYLPGKEHITGYMYEPWHIRYVGVEHATTIMNQGITLEEYLGI